MPGADAQRSEPAVVVNRAKGQEIAGVMARHLMALDDWIVQDLLKDRTCEPVRLRVGQRCKHRASPTTGGPSPLTQGGSAQIGGKCEMPFAVQPSAINGELRALGGSVFEMAEHAHGHLGISQRDVQELFGSRTVGDG
jgi:hypothetical protein